MVCNCLYNNPLCFNSLSYKCPGFSIHCPVCFSRTINATYRSGTSGSSICTNNAPPEYWPAYPGKRKQTRFQEEVKVDFYQTTPYVNIADPRGLKVGQEVIAIGSPAGLSFSVTNGIISALYRDFNHAYNVTQSNTAINPGNSGGPLFNLKGELVGINSFFIMARPEFPVFTGLGFSVQSGQCIEFLTDAAKKFKDMKKYTLKDIFLGRIYSYER